MVVLIREEGWPILLQSGFCGDCPPVMRQKAPLLAKDARNGAPGMVVDGIGWSVDQLSRDAGWFRVGKFQKNDYEFGRASPRFCGPD
jgi:hypothetical protein